MIYLLSIYKLLLIDSSIFTHNLKLSILNNINSIFNNDDITFYKSCGIMNMILNIVNNYIPNGNNFFINGIYNYLTKYKFNNANQTEFWNCFDGYNM